MTRGRHRRQTAARTGRWWLAAALLGAVGVAVVVMSGPGPTPLVRASTPQVAPTPDATFSSPRPSRGAERAFDSASPRSHTPPASAPHQPNRIWMPALGIDAPLVPTTISGGELVIPPPREVGWWSRGAPVDDRSPSGTTLLAAHVNLDGVEGAFAPLYRARYGNRVVLIGPSGTSTEWVVVAVQVVLKSRLPQAIFAPGGRRQIVLVTCTGHLVTDGEVRSYDSNLIVTALPR